MTQPQVKLSIKQRFLHIFFYESIALFILTPLISSLLNESLEHMFSMTVTASLLAALWNFIYNYLFDYVERQLHKDRSKRTLLCRSVHTVLFQGTLATIIIPTIAAFLHINFLQALMLDIGLLSFFMLYTGLYNFVFDFIIFNLIKSL